MKQKRIVGYLDEQTHEEFTRALREEGMTLSGWLRKMIKIFMQKQKQEQNNK